MPWGLVVELSVVRSYRDVVVGGQAVNKDEQYQHDETSQGRYER
jgi:hypothetical protein